MSDANQIGEAFVKIRPKADPAAFQREAEKDLGPAAKKTGDSLSRQLGDALTAGAFVAFSASVVRSAAEAEQAVGGTAAVFKESRGEIDAFAKGSAESLGLTEQATRQFASQIGSALKGYGFSIEDAAATSQKLITKGADLTALFGGTVPEAVTAMSAALRGEFDPLERYGVSLTAAAVAAKAVELGLAESTSKVDGHAKAVATLALIEEQTADSTGQFSRELGTAAGQMAVATAKLGDARDELGSRFLPLVTKGAGLVSSFADAFGALPGPVQASVAAIVALVALQGPLGRTKDKIGEAISEMREGGEAATGFKNKLSALAKTGVIVAGIAAITGGIEAFKAATKESQSSFAESLPDPSDVQGYRDAVNEAVERQHFLSDELNKFNNNDFGKVPEGLAKSWDFFASSITGNVSQVGALKAEYDALTASLPAAKLKAEELTNQVNTLGEGLGITGVQAADMVDDFQGLDISQVPMNKLVDVLGRLRSGEIDTATAAEELGVGVSTAGDKALEAAGKLDELRSGLFGLIDSQHSYADSVQGVADAENAALRAQQGVVDAQRSHEQAVRAVGDAQDAYRDSVESTKDAEERRVESLRSVEDATRALEAAQLALTAAQQGPTESDSLDIESAELRLAEMRERLAGITDPRDRRLAEIEIRQAEIALGERKAEIDARVAEAELGVADAAEQVAEAEQGAQDAAEAVTDAQEAQRDAAVAITDAQYNAGRAYDAITTAQRNAEGASRDVERAKYDQLKASEELRKKMEEETAAFSGANAEAAKLEQYFRNLIALHPELASAIQPLLFLLGAAAQSNGGAPREGGAPGTGTGENAGPTPRPVQDVVDDIVDFIDRSENQAPPDGGRVTQINHFNGVDIREAEQVANHRLALAVGW